ncbi:MAG: restriction endonuclease subunit S [Deltaproteobacteria bacterium]|nr:restriction endonuclease subunit S [Deltaproteobacteria bacterium]
MNDWPIVRLGEVLRQRKEFITIDDLTIYKRPRVRIHVQGIILRDEVPGALIKTKTQQVCQAGEFLVAEIDAKVGGFGIVPDNLQGAIVSSHYFLFVIDESKLDRRFLDYFIRTPAFRDQVEAQGSTNYAAIRPSHVFGYEIPLPPLVEQRRIVAQIEELAAQIHEARNLRQQSTYEAEALHLSVLQQKFVTEALGWMPMSMNEAIEINDKQVDPTLSEYSQLPHISGENMESKTCRLLLYRTAEVDGVKSNNYLFSPGTILYSKIRPYLRKAVFVDFRGVCSAEIYPIRVVNSKLEPNFVKWLLVAEPFTEYANRLSGRTRMPKLNRKQLFGFSFSHPPLAEQRRIVAELDALQAEADRLKYLQAETAAELDALLPAILERAFKGELL